jgi:hypothetical protein
MDILAATEVTGAPAWIIVALSIVLSAGFIAVRFVVFSEWKKRFNALLVTVIMLAYVGVMGHVRGGGFNHIVFLYSVAMTFAFVDSLGGLYLVRKYKRESGVRKNANPDWYVYARRKIALLAIGAALALLCMQDLPIW